MLLALAVLASACQKSIEPEDIVISDVVVSVKIADQGGRGIGGVEVRFAVGADADTLAPFGRGRTAEDGIVSQTFAVPATGSVFTFEIEQPGGVRRRFDSVAIPCSNFQLDVEIPRTLVVACGDQIPDDALALSLCIDTRASDTICTALLDPDCARPMVISAGPAPVPIPGATLLMRLNGAPQPGSSVTLGAGDRCEICLAYSAEPRPARNVLRSPDNLPASRHTD